MTMGVVSPYHSTSPEDPEVYHDHDDCSAGSRILPENWAAGDDGRDLCDFCEDL